MRCDVTADRNFGILGDSCLEPPGRKDFEAFTREMDLLAEIVEDRNLTRLKRLESIAAVGDAEHHSVRPITIEEESEGLGIRMWLR